MSVRRILAASALLASCGLAHAQFTGPSSSQSPYILPSVSGVTTTSIFTVGDTIGGYRMVGIPDGLGAWRDAGQTNFNLVMNHELGATAGVVRAHGQTGAFVSRWEINPANLSVVSGRDHSTSAADAFEFSPTTGTWSNTPSSAQRWSRFCSADLAAPSAYFNAASGLGTQNRLYLNGEEAGAEGRAYAHIVSGPATNQSWQLPHLGKFSWENALASPFAQDKTVVFGLDDSSPGQNYLYIGNKTNSGNDIERAGLTNGNLYGIRVASTPSEPRTPGIAADTRFDLAAFGNVATTTGASLQTQSVSAGVTEFLRPEDGAWDPRPGKQNDFYFVTTDRVDSPSQVGRSRLYRMRFDDITNPQAGGAITELFSTAQGPQMMDNLCIDSLGRILIQEDIGNNALLGSIWMYDINSGNYGRIAQHDASRFISGAPGFLTQDEEASGIIDAKDILGDGWFLMDVQAHYAIPGELVEGGQLLAMYVDPSITPAPGAGALLAIGGIMAARRRRN